MTSVDHDFKTSLKSILPGRVCIVGVGNRQRGDDGAGPRLIDSRDPACPGFWLDAGVAPENFLEVIAGSNPDTVLFVDAVAFGGLPGEYRLMEASVMDAMSVSTHVGSLAILGEYLSGRTRAQVLVLAIQPKAVDMQEGLSQQVQSSIGKLSAMLHDVLISDPCGS